MKINALEIAAAKITLDELHAVVEAEGGSPSAYYIFKEPEDVVGVVHFIGADAIPMQRWDDNAVFTYALVKFLTEHKAPVFDNIDTLLEYEMKLAKEHEL